MAEFGWRVWQEVAASGRFHCPRCNTLRYYQQKCIVKRPVWHVLLLFKEQLIDEFVECQACRQTFQPEVLQYNPALATDRLMLSIKYALESGTPAQVLQDELVSSGMNAAGAARLVDSASDGQRKSCSNCGAEQAGGLLRCRQCNGLSNPTC
jgi:hypothetical protein